MLRKQKRTRLIFLLLSGYVLFQFFWWAFHIVTLHGEIRDLQLQLMPEATESVNHIYNQKVWMVIGEGIVFVALLLFGLWRIGEYLRKEAELARQERNFMLAVTHELKTPVATLRLFLDTLRSRRLPEEKQLSMLSDAVDETHRLDHLVENILLSTRLDNELNDTSQTIDLSELTRKIVRKLHSSIGQTHETELDIEGQLRLKGDENNLESLIANLYENAIKYSPEGSTIRIGVHEQDGHALLTVQDQGGGIPAAEHERIFRKFYRIGNEETRQTKGTGLGLYLVERITLQHRGKVQVKSRDGGGSTFEVSLPLAEK